MEWRDCWLILRIIFSFSQGFRVMLSFFRLSLRVVFCSSWFVASVAVVVVVVDVAVSLSWLLSDLRTGLGGRERLGRLTYNWILHQRTILRKNQENALKCFDNYGETCKRNVIHFYLLVGFLRCLQDGFCSGVHVRELKLIRVQGFMTLLALLLWDLNTTT